MAYNTVQEALDKALKEKNKYQENLVGKTFAYAYINKFTNIISIKEIVFKRENYLHLTGLDYRSAQYKKRVLGINAPTYADEFYDRLGTDGKLINDVDFIIESTAQKTLLTLRHTQNKLDNLSQIVNIAKKAEYIAEYNDPNKYDLIINRNKETLAFIKDGDVYVPMSSRHGDVNKFINGNSKSPVLAIFSKSEGQKNYQIEYLNASVKFDKAQFDKETYEKLSLSSFENPNVKFNNELTCDKAEFYVAVLSAGGSEEFRAEPGSRINFEEIHILSDASSFKNTKFDIKQERYIIKDRILETWNNDRCDLQSNGYHIELHNRGNGQNIRLDDQNHPEYDDKHHIINDYHKPYVIIYFDNPGDNEYNHGIGRKLSTLSKVFLYVGINNSEGMENLPFFVLRDILSCRDMIMNMLEDDFDGEIMQKHAKSVQEEIVITHERSASHMSTTDERGSLQVFGLGYVSDLNYILHPLDLKTRRLIENNGVKCFQRAELWLLFQNYVNGQIARLFNRSFSLNNSTINDEDVPKLYLETDERLESDVFKQTARQFSDLNISCDERFNMLKKVVHMHIDIAEDTKFFSAAVNGKDFYYNCEFIKCILFDIFFSAIKYATTDASFLPRVDNLIWYYDSFGPSGLHSYVFLLRENENLIILNNVNTNRIDTSKCDRKNEEIYRRTHDPLDYGDGHMSLFTIRQFVLGIRNLNNPNRSGKDNCDTKFKYINLNDAKQVIQNHNAQLNENAVKYNYWFLTQLPIFMEDTNNEYNNLDQ